MLELVRAKMIIDAESSHNIVVGKNGGSAGASALSSKGLIQSPIKPDQIKAKQIQSP